MRERLKKTPIGAGLLFLVACSACLLPAVGASVIVSVAISGAGVLANSTFVIAAGSVVVATAIMGFVMLRRRGSGDGASC